MNDGGAVLLRQSATELNLLFVLMPLAMLAAVALGLRLFPGVWARTMRGEDAARNRTMDGARGLLTLWVLTHHLNIAPVLLQPGGAVRQSRGAVGLLIASPFFVAPFFMLSAMLFGGRLLRTGGEMDAVQFLRDRALRLAPAYLVSLVLVFAAVAVVSGFELRVPPVKLLKQVARWSSFGFARLYDINGVDVWRWHGMLWTLPYEIRFYLLLPLLAWAQRRTGSPIPLLVVPAAIGCLFAWPFIFFAAGILAAAALGAPRFRAPRAWSVAAAAAIGLIAATAGRGGPLFQALLQAALLVPVLAAVAVEAPLLQPLSWRPLRLVGEIGYSVYILHVPLMSIVFAVVTDPRRWQEPAFLPRVGALACLGVLILLAAGLCHVLVERRAVAWGKRLGGERSARPAAKADPATAARSAPTPR